MSAEFSLQSPVLEKKNTPAVDFPKGNLVGFTLKKIKKGYSKNKIK